MARFSCCTLTCPRIREECARGGILHAPFGTRMSHGFQASEDCRLAGRSRVGKRSCHCGCRWSSLGFAPFMYGVTIAYRTGFIAAIVGIISQGTSAVGVLNVVTLSEGRIEQWRDPLHSSGPLAGWPTPAGWGRDSLTAEWCVKGRALHGYSVMTAGARFLSRTSCRSIPILPATRERIPAGVRARRDSRTSAYSPLVLLSSLGAGT
jgi:hypothetical protein